MKRVLAVAMIILFSCTAQPPPQQPTEETTAIKSQPKTTIKTSVKIAVINPAKDSSKISMVTPVLALLPKTDKISTKVFHYSDRDGFILFSPDIVIITGQSTPWEEYEISDFYYIKEYLENKKVPALGICGGHQLFALLWGGSVDLINVESCNKSEGYSGCFKLKGFVPVTITETDSDLFKGYPLKTKFYVSHCEEIKQMPEDFIVIATHSLVKVYAIKHVRLPVYGVQFHPELPANNPSQGHAVIDNFLKAANSHLGITEIVPLASVVFLNP
ncbi:MAG: gamma-glutamyl-gamma-aminobutyrate hydrolase family protein [Spirochaetes bacterium]|nr:gamma-glutamyl-gamma-aminobutyrate hydrolase family protein [Spirochaetota bacterium]